MNAKEFILHWRKEKDIRHGAVNWPTGLWHECMEAYHRAKVEAVTNEIIGAQADEEYERYETDEFHEVANYAFSVGGEWVRDKLLNQ